LKIDIFPHIIPPKYKNTLYNKADGTFYSKKWDHVIDATPALFDLDMRFNAMGKYEELLQVLTVSAPAVEEIADPEKATYLSKLVNDEMAELIEKYPDKFIAGVACLPMNSMGEALKEAERAVKDLNFKGVQIFTPINGKPIDALEFLPLYEEMSRYDLPIWIHPSRGRNTEDYPNEGHSKYWIFQMFGWPYETTAAMTRLVFSGIMDKYPNLKFITHHCGGMIPFFEQRIVSGQDYAETCLKAGYKKSLKMNPIEYFQRFYADTAINGSVSGLMCGYKFFSAKHIVFATDMPYDSENGNRSIREVIRSINEMDIDDDERKLIFEGNARRLLHLPAKV